jgi:TonB-linked SusC/RagA family outer membrane protein
MYKNSTAIKCRWSSCVKYKPFLIMKLSFLICLITIMNVSASTYAQQVNLNKTNASLIDVLNDIHQQSGYSLLYNAKLLRKAQPLNLQLKNVSLDEALKQSLTGQPFTYVINQHTIVITPKPQVELIEQAKITITGTVTDTLGETIPGATVTVIGKTIATKTDVNGKFVLDVEPGSTIRVSFVGYKEQQVIITATTKVVNIKLKAAVTVTEEVVITAYGKKERKEALVGSVTSISPGDLKIPASNLTNALAGQVAGLIAYQPTGQPGLDNSQFFIRGVTTFGYNKSPLILIDNVELSSNDLARLNVDDIQSFSILKDASATALYGARGANGVILVTTKEGKIGKSQIGFRVENSSSQSAQTIQLADPITYMKLFNEATTTRDPLAQLPFSPNKILNTQAALNGAPGSNPYMYPAVNWVDMLFKKRTNTTRTDMNVSGGGDVARYYVAGSYSVDHGILKEDIANNNDNNVKFENYQLRSNININLTKSTELIVRLAGTFSNYNGPQTTDASFSTDLYNVALHTNPVLFPAYFPADSANLKTQHILFGGPAITGPAAIPAFSNQSFINPYAALLRGHKNYTESRISAQLEINQNLSGITQGLNLHGLFHTNRYSYFDSAMGYSPFYYNINTYNKATNQYTLTWLNPTAGVATEYLGYNQGNNSTSSFTYFQGVLDYNRTFGGHSLSSSLIGTAQQTIYGNQSTLLGSLPYRNLTVAGRATYSYKARYYLEFNFGYNGTERFSADHRFGFFPTIGASWVVSNEKFWTDDLSRIISRLKLRGSYGLVGNDNIGSQRFYYNSNVNLAGGNPATFGTTNGYSRPGVTINNYANNDITWETSRQANVGLEFTLLKNMNIVAEAYSYHRYNILQTRTTIPSTLGLESSIAANLGTADTKGIDLSMDYKQNIGKNFWAQGRANLTYANTNYGQWEEPQYSANEAYRYQSGQAIGRNIGYVAERLFVDDAEAKNSPKQTFSTGGTAPKGGDIKYRDLNGDGVIDSKDQTFIGYPTIPAIVYGYGISTGYKNFDLSAFFQGQAHVSFLIDPARVSPFIQSPDSNIPGNTQLLQAFADNHWSVDNQNLYALYPRLGANGAQIENNRQNSTWWLRSGSFMRLKSLEIGYTLPKSLSTKLALKKCRIYFNGLNLYTWSEFKLWDPELGGNGFAYPIQKVFNIGLNVTL